MKISLVIILITLALAAVTVVGFLQTDTEANRAEIVQPTPTQVQLTPTSRPTSPPTLTTMPTVEPTQAAQGKIFFFYGSTCPHCHDVLEWMEENGVESLVEVEKKEVYQDQDNSQQLSAAAQSCGIPLDRVGVPFVFTHDKQCLVGAPKVKAYLSEQANL